MSSERPTRQIVLNGVLLVLLGAFLARLPQTLAMFFGVGAWIEPIQRVHDRVSDQYVEPIGEDEQEALQLAAIRGMLDALGDPYAEYIPPSEAEAFEKSLTGAFVGIGAEVRLEDGWMTIVTPMQDSPALEAGLRPGDRIVAIAGRTTAGETLDQSIERIKGEPGTVVRLTVERPGVVGESGAAEEAEQFEMNVTRRAIVARAVRGVRRDGANGGWSYLMDPALGIAYVRVTQFTPTAADEAARAIAQAQENTDSGKLGGIILDLRDNPGGDLEAALSMSNLFLPDGPVLAVAGREGVVERFEAEAPMVVPTDVPLVVVVNEVSASASEIVSGSLKDRGRALIVGARTFGKGLVQSVEHVPGVPGARLKYTRQRYELPGGEALHRSDTSPRWGVDPSPGYFVPEPDGLWMKRARARLPYEIVRSAVEPADAALADARFNDPSWVEHNMFDPQLAVALRAAQMRAKGENATPPGDPETEAAEIAAHEMRRLEAARAALVAELMDPDTRFAASAMLEEVAKLDVRIAAVRALAERAPGGVALDAAGAAPTDLWSDDVDLTAGRIEVYDAAGRRVADLVVPGDAGLELRLLQAGARPATGDDETGGGEGGGG